MAAFLLYQTGSGRLRRTGNKTKETFTSIKIHVVV